jgi:hypothetical protein
LSNKGGCFINSHARQAAEWCTAVFLACFASSAWALLFDFNTLVKGSNTGAANTAVQNYMQAILTGAGAGTVVVTGSRADTDYTGDSYVVGPVSQTVVTPLTLGDTDGGVRHALPWDAYLVNQDGFDRITLVFSRPVYKVSFDFEIFPDGTCPFVGASGCKNNTAANWPDFSLRAGSTSSTDLVFRSLGLGPSDMTNTMTDRKSPMSYPNNEQAPQLLGVSGDWLFAEGVTKFEFVDWPRRIGIDNLTITLVPPRSLALVPHVPDPHVPDPQVPEPGTLALLSLGFAGVWLRRRPVV